MKILDFFRIFKRKIASKTKRNAHLPLSWDDDYCQIEIVPAENRESIEKRITEVKILADQSREGLGFTEIFEVGQIQCDDPNAKTADMEQPMGDAYNRYIAELIQKNEAL